MITIFELKNKSYCGCFIRTPYYIKNFFILVALLLLLSVTYLIYFSREGVYMKSITKILRGLNSDCFLIFILTCFCRLILVSCSNGFLQRNLWWLFSDFLSLSTSFSEKSRLLDCLPLLKSSVSAFVCVNFLI
jgi:hypothetical protein